MTSTPWSPNDISDLDRALTTASGEFTDRTRALLADALDLAQDAMEKQSIEKQFRAAQSAAGTGVDLRTVADHIRTPPPPAPIKPEPVDPGPEPVDPGPDPIDPGPEPVDPEPEPVDPGPDPIDLGPTS
jgi:hypothetical protein